MENISYIFNFYFTLWLDGLGLKGGGWRRGAEEAAPAAIQVSMLVILL
jgi:hypothetical protein